LKLGTVFLAGVAELVDAQDLKFDGKKNQLREFSRQLHDFPPLTFHQL
jgi:hypothetical protein